MVRSIHSKRDLVLLRAGLFPSVSRSYVMKDHIITILTDRYDLSGSVNSDSLNIFDNQSVIHSAKFCAAGKWRV